jgi:hypothetical protein
MMAMFAKPDGADPPLVFMAFASKTPAWFRNLKVWNVSLP